MKGIKKLLSILLSFILILNTLPTMVFASVLGNTPDQNAQILSELTQFWGDEKTAQEALQLLRKYNLVDENGNVLTDWSKSITIYEGESSRITNVTELLSMIEDENTDRNIRIDVDGTIITLGEFEKMMEIESEIKRIKDTYFPEGGSNELTQEQSENLQSLYSQIQTRGLTLYNTRGSDTNRFPSGIDQNVKISISGNDRADINSTYTVNVTLSKAQTVNVTYSYRALSGSIQASGNGERTIQAGQTTDSFTVNVGNSAGRLQGDGVFVVQVYNVKNALFESGYNTASKTVKASKNDNFKYRMAIPITINSNGRVPDNPLYDIYPEKCSTQYSFTSSGLSDGMYEKKLGIDNNTFTFTYSQLFESNEHSKLRFQILAGKTKTNNGNKNKDYNYQFDEVNVVTDGRVNRHVHTSKYEVTGSLTHRFEMSLGSERVSSGSNITVEEVCVRVNNPVMFVSSKTNPTGVVPEYYPLMPAFELVGEVIFVDTKSTANATISAPQGNYRTGDVIPITVKFDYPMLIRANMTITVNGRVLTAIDQYSTQECATFLYTVPSVDNSRLLLEANTISGSLGANGEPIVVSGLTSQSPINGVTITTPLLREAINETGNVLSNSNILRYQPATGDTPAKTVANVGLFFPPSTIPEHATLLSDTYIGEGNRTYSSLIAASIDGGQNLIPVVVSNFGSGKALRVTIEIDAEELVNNNHFVMEFFTIDPTTHESTGLLFGRYASFSVNPPVPLMVENLSITTPVDWPTEAIYVNNPPENLTLSANVTPPANCTWTQTRWVSSNESIATIDSTGKVFPQGPGEVQFYLEAVNGGLTDLYNFGVQRSHPVSLTIKEGASPYLLIPENTIRILSGDVATLRWASNLVQKNATNNTNSITTFNIKVYQGSTINGAPVIERDVTYDPSQSATNSDLWVGGSPNLSLSLSGLSEISVGGQPSYTIVVSGQYNANGPSVSQEFSAMASVFVTSKPVSVKLTRPEKLFVVNEGNLTVPYSIKNFDIGNNAAFELVVTNNATGQEVIKLTEPTSLEGGTIILDLSSAEIQNGFRTIFDVSIKAKNTAERDWSRDSFTLYVYDKNSLDVLVQPLENDRVVVSDDGNKVTMSNEEWIKSLTEDQIIALNRDIDLQTVISINYQERAWGEATDRMKWAVKDSDVASINFPQAGYYSDIKDLPYSSYAPITNFLLSGKNNGETVVDVNHALAGESLKSSVDVSVKTLKDKLYLFQFYPVGVATISYKNGSGESKTHTTDSNGRAAVYEESGINSDVFVEATISGDKYIGTVYKHSLVSQEKDSVTLELYPLNSLTLRKAATVPIYLKKPDGSDFNGTVKVRTGVMRNGEYCENAMYSTTDGAVNVSGKTDSTVTFTNGKAVFRYDMTQFNTENGTKPVTQADKIEFVIELRAEGYFPVLYTTSGDLNAEESIKLSEHVVNLETASQSQKNKPFIAQQVAYFNGTKDGYGVDVKNKTGKVGPSADFKDILVSTTVLWWGKENNNKRRYITYSDALGKDLENQTSEFELYSFLSMPVSFRNVKLNKSQFDHLGMKSNSIRNLSIEYVEMDSNNSFKVTKTEALRWQMINLDAESPVKSQNLLDQILYLTNIDRSSDGVSNFKNDFLGTGIAIATKNGIDLPFIKLKLSPTSDPTVFKGLIYAGLNNFEGDNVSHMGGDSSRGSDIDYMPGFADLKGLKNDFKQHSKTMLKQVGYAANILKKNVMQGSGTSRTKDGAMAYALQGLMETEVFFDFETNKWKMVVTSGSLTAGGGYGYEWTWNTQVGPVPVFLQLGLGAAGSVQFNAAVDRTRDGTDFLTELRLYAYLEAFGGLGFDYSVIALKIGIYGSVQLHATLRWLNAIGQSTAFGAKLNLTGEIGVKFQAKILFISYEKILWSRPIVQYSGKFHKWDQIDEYWEKVKKGNSGQGLISPTGSSGSTASTGVGVASGTTALRAKSFGVLSDTQIYEADQSAVLEDRDYLEQYVRSYDTSGPSLENTSGTVLRRLRRALRSGPVVTTLDNSYPLASPALTDDGKYLFYLSDGNDPSDATKVRIAYMVRNAQGGYNNQSIINDEGYGDSGLRATGSGDLAVAVWSRLTQSPRITEPGQVVTPDIQADMMNNTDIYVAVKNDAGGSGTTGTGGQTGAGTSASWIVKNITQSSGTADLSPVVATNGSRIIVAWRQVASSSLNSLTDFSERDYIYYSVSEDAGQNWTDPQPIFNGTSGSVKGIEASMLDSGEAAVVFTINQSEISQTNTEVAYAIIDKVSDEYDVVKYVQMTYDENIDENPQIASVDLTTDNEVFVIGWHSTEISSGLSDIRLAAVDAQGNRVTGFVDSMSRLVESSDVQISSNFEFVQNAGSLDELSVLWSDTVTDNGADEGNGDPVRGSLNAIRFRTENVGGTPKISMTSPQKIVQMANYTSIDNFSAYVNDSGKLYAALQGTYYDYENPDSIQVDYGNGETGSVAVAQEKTSIYTVVGEYTNTIRVDAVMPDFEHIRKGAFLPVQVSLTNLGTEPITRLEVVLGENADAQTTVFDANPPSSFAQIAPGETRSLFVHYTVPSTGAIPNPKYKITGAFERGEANFKDGVLVHNVPDLGIAENGYVQDEVNGDRILQFVLYNTSEAELKDSNRTVRFALYKDAEYTELIEPEYLTLQGGQNTEADGSLRISGDDLSKVDEGSYSVNYVFNLEDYIKQDDLDLQDESGEVRDGGVSVYAKAWIEFTSESSSEPQEMVEFVSNNNLATLNFESLYKLSGGNITTITSELLNEEDQSGATVNVMLQNNSMAQRTSGNVIVSLLDDNGKVIEEKQSFDPENNDNKGLLQLDVEERAVKSFSFSRTGSSVQVTYSDAKLDSTSNSNIATLSVEGVELSYDANTRVYSGNARNLQKTLISITTEDPRAKVTVNGVNYTSAVDKNLIIGENVIQIEVTSVDSSSKQRYKLSITNVKPSETTPQDNSGETSEFDYYADNSDQNQNEDATKFTDVSKTAYYYDALVWALSKGIVKGTSETTFSPNEVGNRAQVVTLLWRAAGSPTPKATETTFVDISLKDYYYLAAIWAIENGITTGTADKNFSPFVNCTRAQMVTFLWRAAGSPEPSISTNIFTDVDKDKYYYKAVLWATEKGITKGTSVSSFSPDAICTRSHIVTFLFRSVK